MRVRPRVIALTLAALAAITVPAFAGGRISSQFLLEGSETPAATPSGTPSAVLEFEGEVFTIATDSWVVGDQIFLIAPDTEIEHDPQVGDFVEVKAVQNADGTLTALEIELEDEDEGEVDEEEDDDLDDDADEDEDDDLDDEDEDEDEHDDHDEDEGQGHEEDDDDEGDLDD